MYKNIAFYDCLVKNELTCILISNASPIPLICPKNVVSNNITQAMSTDLLGERSRRHCPIHISKWQGEGLVFPHEPTFMELKCMHYYFWRAQHTVDLLVLKGIWNSRIYFLSTWLRSKIVTSPQYVHSNT